MSNGSNRKSAIKCYVTQNNIYCQQVRIVLAEKGINYSVIPCETAAQLSELEKINPYKELPTLVDRDLVLYNSKIIMEYLDERFPHPPLLPIYPIAKAKTRIVIARIDIEWYVLFNKIDNLRNQGKNYEGYLDKLITSIREIVPAFSNNKYFLNNEFSLLDCWLGPILWQLQKNYKLNLMSLFSNELYNYVVRIFNRDSFIKSLEGTMEPKVVSLFYKLMTPSRPYLLRALYSWIVDNNMEPFVVVNANFVGVKVPTQYINNGQIILNISPGAVRNLKMENKYLSFLTKFSGLSYKIHLPIMAITAIYAEENKRGMIFLEEGEDIEGKTDNLEVSKKPISLSKIKKDKPQLTLVSNLSISKEGKDKDDK